MGITSGIMGSGGCGKVSCSLTMLLFVTRHCQLLTHNRIFFSFFQNYFFNFPAVAHICTQSSTDTCTNAYDDNDSHTDTLTEAGMDTDENDFVTRAWWALEAVGK
jgi:hypothetical protein